MFNPYRGYPITVICPLTLFEGLLSTSTTATDSFIQNLQSHIMGDAAIEKTERLLVIFFKKLPPPLVAHIQRQFPEAELTTYQSQKGVPVPRG